MRYKIILIFLFFVTLHLKATILPDPPQDAVPIRLNVEYFSPKLTTYPIKRQPGAGIFLYLYVRTLFVPDLEVPYSICLINDNDVVVFCMSIVPGQNSIILPENLTGVFFVKLESSEVCYTGNLELI